MYRSFVDELDPVSNLTFCNLSALRRFNTTTENIPDNLMASQRAPQPPGCYNGEKVANREMRVWHGATANGP